MIWADANDDSDRSITGPLIGAIGTFGVSLVFATEAFKNRRNAILSYNSQFDDRSAHLGPTNNGLGLTVNF